MLLLRATGEHKNLRKQAFCEFVLKDVEILERLTFDVTVSVNSFFCFWHHLFEAKSAAAINQITISRNFIKNTTKQKKTHFKHPFIVKSKSN